MTATLKSQSAPISKVVATPATETITSVEALSTIAPYRFTVEAYRRAYAIGFFEESFRTELIHGTIYPISPISSPHAATVDILVYEWTTLSSKRWWVRGQGPLDLTDLHSVPQPDVLICDWRDDRYANASPRVDEITLIVEVALSSLPYDRTIKKAIYQEAGIPEYWIVNLKDRQFECFTEPKGEVGYRTKKIYVEGDTFSHELLGEIVVSDLLPMPQTETPTTPPA